MKNVMKPKHHCLPEFRTQCYCIYAHNLSEHNISTIVSVFFMITCSLNGLTLCLNKVIVSQTLAKIVGKCLIFQALWSRADLQP